MQKAVWKESALKQLLEACNYIYERSPQNADKVLMEIEEKAKEIARHPESRSLDKYKLNNNGNYRYFTLHHLRISYRIVKEGIIISSVRHDKQKPRYY